MNKIILVIAAMVMTMLSGCSWTSPVTGNTYTEKDLQKAYKVGKGVVGISSNIYLDPMIQAKLPDDAKVKLENAYLHAKNGDELILKIKEIVKEETGDVLLISEDQNTSYISIVGGDNAIP